VSQTASTVIETSQAVFNFASLPDGWRLMRLDEVCDFLDSRRIPVNNTERAKRMAGKAQSELFPYYGANGQTGWIDDYLFDEPLILLAEDGGNFGSKDKPIAYSVSGRYWVNNHAHVLRPKESIIKPVA
jgi:type I restriction enzyme S subunit